MGAGGFFRAVHLPILVAHDGFDLRAIASRTGLQLRDLGLRHHVPSVTTDSEEILNDPDIDAVLIATRHDLHAALVLKALAAGKHVFVEKPMALTSAECEQIVEAVRQSDLLLAVGFNRRFSPHALRAKKLLTTREPKTMVYRVNAGALPPGHWLRDPVEGGGRLMGEGVHFFDFLRWLVDADPADVRASSVVLDGRSDADNVAATVTFADGSLGVLVYASGGDAGAGKERIEVFSGGRTVVLDDFRALEVHGGPGGGSQKSRVIEKGHKEILDNFCRAIRGEVVLGVTAQDGLWATWCAERALRQIQLGRQLVLE
jgi:predicted dehydrogenase